MEKRMNSHLRMSISRIPPQTKPGDALTYCIELRLPVGAHSKERGWLKNKLSGVVDD